MKIAIKQGPNAGRELDVEAQTIIGRDPASAQIVIDDPEASRRHASVTPSGTGVTIEDLGSTNGTFVNGQRISGAQEAGAGDEIRIGATVLEVQSTAEVTRMASIPEPADADATAIGSPVPEPPSGPEPAAAEPPAEPVSASLPPDPPPPDLDAGPAPWQEPTETAPPAAAPSGGPGDPPPPDFGTPPPPAGGPPPPPGAGQGYGAPEQGYAPPPPPQYGQPGGAMVPGGYAPAGGIETRDSTTTWLLCAFVPFYALYHFHRTNKELVAWSRGQIDYNATSSLLALTIGVYVLIPPFVALSSFCGRVRHAQAMAGLEQQCTFGGFFLRLLLLSYGWKWLQDQLNEIAVRQPQGW